MASTTTSKKGIIDFLWDWAENRGTWAELLIDTIVKTENQLMQRDRETIFDYFIDSLRTTKKLPELRIEKPLYNPTTKSTFIKSLKDIEGVNRLAKNQTINFSKNITVIYGENGTGKTGYGRILKSLGFSYDTKNSIHHNIYSVNTPKSALIDFEANGIASTFKWDGSQSHSELSNISVFNNNCVNLSLNDNRRLLVSPIGFHLFDIVTSELTALGIMLNQKIQSYPTKITWLETLTAGTSLYKFLSTLNSNSTENQLQDFATFSKENESDLSKKELELKNLHPELIRSQITSFSLQLSELNSIISKIESTQLAFSQVQWASLINYNSQISLLENKSQVGINDIAKSNGIEFYDTKEFKDFILSADKYLKILNQTTYPKVGDTCIYCKQPLDNPAQELLVSYQKLLNDATQKDLQKKIVDRDALINSVKKIETTINFNYPIFGVDENGKALQPKECIIYNFKLASLKEVFTKNTLLADSKFDLDFNKLLKLLEETKTKIEKNISEKSELLSSINTKIDKLTLEICELKDRKTVSLKVEDVKTTIKNIKIVELLNSKSSEFNTLPISKKTTAARAELVEKDFDRLFQSELKAFRKSHIKIELFFGTDKGNSKITQRLNKSYSLVEILSEGEQKAIALAEFLTELQLDNIISPVIFDDPVNSLDHRIIDEVAKRLIELSKTRQVVVFTHSILLLNSFIQQRDIEKDKKTNVDFTFYSVKNNFQETGILEDVEEVNSFSYYEKKLVQIVNSKPKENEDESKLAAQGYGHLRSAIEIYVEETILKNIIRRYRKGVAFPALMRIEGSKIDKFKGELNNIYEKCCVSIDGHSSPVEIHTTPTINELKDDYELFKQLKSSFAK